ncbi:MAG: RING finger protein [Candidatus Hodarchaeales archaeon]|jgi:hypothetical protein
MGNNLWVRNKQPAIATFMRSWFLNDLGVFFGCMTSQHNDELNKKWADRIPFLWKRKVKNYIKKDSQNALEVFFQNFSIKKDSEQMKYGLTLLLPLSLEYIISSLNDLSPLETVTFLELLATPKFLDVIRTINSEKQQPILTHIYENWEINHLNDETVSNLLAAVNPEFLRSSIEKNDNLVFTAYLESDSEPLNQILRPILQDIASKSWQIFLNVLTQKRKILVEEQVLDIFIKCNGKIKRKIGNYIIEKNLISSLSLFFNDFEIFRAVLTSTREISLIDQKELEHFVNKHISTRFNDIIVLGKRITLPKEIFFSSINKKHLTTLLEALGSGIELFRYWEEVILAFPGESLPVTLNSFTKKGLSKKRKELLSSLLKKLIISEPILFWNYFGSLNSNNITIKHLQPILFHAMEVSIPNLAEIVSLLPDFHLNLLIEQILPDLSSSGSKILYSLFSIPENVTIDASAFHRVILELIKTDPENMLLISFIRCSKTVNSPKYKKFVPTLIKELLSRYSEESIAIITSHNLSTLITPVESFLSSLSKSKLESFLINIIPKLKSNIINGVITSHLLKILNRNKNDISLLQKLFTIVEKKELSISGKKILLDLVTKLVGTTSNYDLLIFSSLKTKILNKSELLSIFFAQTSQQTIERIILDPLHDPLDESIIKAIYSRFTSQPPEKPYDYFLDLYQKLHGRDTLQQEILPLLGEYSDWQNLAVLMELPEKEKYSETYDGALTNFASRFNIQSAEALRQIWSSGGLKSVFKRLEKPQTLKQSRCPQCGNPILENQKTCGFCSQRLACIICRKSVVKAEAIDVVQCPQCGNFFHKRHLHESIKMKKSCPVCNVKITEQEAISLPGYTFFFH